MSTEVVIVSAVRTPIGKFQGGLASLTAPQLGAIAVREAVRRAGIKPGVVDEVIMGNVLQAGVGQNPARQAAILGGLPDTTNAFTINKVCGSGLKAVMLAAQAIRSGDAEVVIAGGMESMSNAPYLLKEARNGYRMGNGTLIDSMVHDGLTDVYNQFHMGMAAEMVAEKYGITREEQDAFAAESHRRAMASINGGHFAEEIVPVEIPQKKGDPIRVTTDEGPRADTSVESLSKLRPAFKKDGGTVTAGNAPSVNDGAAALVVMNAARAQALGLKPMARIVGYTSAHLDPKWLFIAPVDAVRKLYAKTGLNNSKVGIAELNEAFSVQALACVRDLEMDSAMVNPGGGAVALGHPIGASGARVLITLLYGLKRSGKQTGITSLCLGGGGAVALAVETM